MYRSGPTPAPDAKVVIVVPPFQSIVRPSLAAGQLKANLRAAGFDAEVLYLNLLFADQIGAHVFDWISESVTRSLFGEFLFSRSLFAGSEEDFQRFADE